MKPLREVALAYSALSDAEYRLLDKAYDAAIESSQKAMDISQTIPEEEAFDHSGFNAFCHAILSVAFSKLGRFAESLKSAEDALHHFNRRGELNLDDGKLWIKAVYGHALACEGLGRTTDALAEFRKAGEMLAERKGEMPGKEEMLQTINERIKLLQSAPSASLKQPGYKAWWEFWS
jgi:tetratricopeptide (TPR) repeat protein